MGELLNFLADFVLMMFLGWVIAQLLMLWAVRRLSRELEKHVKVESETEQQRIGLTVEKIGNEFFCWNEKDNEFVCQGSDLEEIRKRFRQRFPNADAYLAGGPAVDALRKQLETSKK